MAFGKALAREKAQALGYSGVRAAVVDLMGQGLTNRQIAARIGISTASVSLQRQVIPNVVTLPGLECETCNSVTVCRSRLRKQLMATCEHPLIPAAAKGRLDDRYANAHTRRAARVLIADEHIRRDYWRPIWMRVMPDE